MDSELPHSSCGSHHLGKVCDLSSMICSSVPQDETKRKRKEIHFLHNHLPFHLGFISKVPQIFNDHELKVPV